MSGANKNRTETWFTLVAVAVGLPIAVVAALVAFFGSIKQIASSLARCA